MLKMNGVKNWAVRVRAGLLLGAFGVLLAGVLTPAETVAQVGGVVAVVNENIITRQDLDRRFQLTLRKISQKLTQEQQKRIYRQTLNILVDEELQRQYANRIGLAVAPELVEETIQRIQKGTGGEGFGQMVSGLEDVVFQELEAELRLRDIVNKVVRPRIDISSAELDQIIKGLVTGQSVSEFEISQIFVPSEESESEEKINALAQQLAAGQPFADVAKVALSMGASGSEDGYLGWFRLGELAPQLEEILQTMAVGTASAPVQTTTGWHIVFLKQKRESKPFNTEPIKQILVAKVAATLPENKPEQEALRAQFKELKKKLKTLADVEDVLRAEEKNPAFKPSQVFGWKAVEELPSEISKAVAKVGEGEFSPILELNGELVLILNTGSRMVLDEKLEAYRNKVWQQMMETRVNLAARRLVRDLRRHAYVDLRLE